MELLNAGDWDKFTEEVRDFQKPTVRKPLGVAEPLDELIRSTAKKAVNGIDELSELAVLNPEYLDKVSGAVGLQTRVLVELVKRFDQLYSEAKRTINCLDFADLEHQALRLLSAEDSLQAYICR
jgi:ATP-dependent exoDNAse (exonuclease V) beta subunit